jgi:hypothetical protein
MSEGKFFKAHVEIGGIEYEAYGKTEKKACEAVYQHVQRKLGKEAPSKSEVKTTVRELYGPLPHSLQ